MFNSYVKLRIHLKPMGQWALFSVNHISYLGPTCLAGAAPLQSGDAKLVEFMGYDYPHHETWPGESSKKMVFLNGKIMDNSWIFHCYGWLPKGIYYIKNIYIYLYIPWEPKPAEILWYIYIWRWGDGDKPSGNLSQFSTCDPCLPVRKLLCSLLEAIGFVDSNILLVPLFEMITQLL